VGGLGTGPEGAAPVGGWLGAERRPCAQSCTWRADRPRRRREARDPGRDLMGLRRPAERGSVQFGWRQRTQHPLYRQSHCKHGAVAARRAVKLQSYRQIIAGEPCREAQPGYSGDRSRIGVVNVSQKGVDLRAV
jgi:hypothetical protein